MGVFKTLFCIFASKNIFVGRQRYLPPPQTHSPQHATGRSPEPPNMITSYNYLKLFYLYIKDRLVIIFNKKTRRFTYTPCTLCIRSRYDVFYGTVLTIPYANGTAVRQRLNNKIEQPPRQVYAAASAGYLLDISCIRLYVSYKGQSTLHRPAPLTGRPRPQRHKTKGRRICTTHCFVSSSH